MIELSADPDIPSVVYCDTDACDRWQGLSDDEVPFGWIAVLEVGYPGDTTRPLSFCSWRCLKRRADLICG